MGALYSHTTRADGLTLTAAIYNADHQNHIDNGIPAQLDDYSTNATVMNTTTDPGESGSESLATTLAGELERLRFAILDAKQGLCGSTEITKWYQTPTAKHFIGTVSTTNSFITVGLQIDQADNDDTILAFRSTGDVSHNMTDLAQSQVFGHVKKINGANGGMQLEGFSDVSHGVRIKGNHNTDDTTKSTAGVGAVSISGALRSGTSVTTLGANANILTVENSTTTRFILDGDGDSHQDVGTAWTNFDSHDDIALLHGLSAGVARPGDPVREQFQSFLEDNRATLEQIKLVTFNEDGHHFVNMSKLAMLNTGAIRQLAGRLEQVERLLLPSR